MIESSPGKINAEIKIKLLGTYYRIEKELKVKNRACQYLLNLYKENINELMNNYVEYLLPE